MSEKNLVLEALGATSLVNLANISQLTGLSSSDISNRRRRKPETFPIDRNTGKGNPCYHFEDVLVWARGENIPVRGKRVRLRDIQRLQQKTGATLNISLVGRARTGKSFLASYFAENPLLMRQALCGEGSDYTQVPTKISLCDTSPYFRFSIKDKFPAPVDDALKPYLNRFVSINPDAPDFPNTIAAINAWLRKLHVEQKSEQKFEHLDQMVTLEIYTKPSEMVQDILTQTGKQALVLTDTPGLSGDYSFDSLGRQDLVIIAMRDDNMQEFSDSIERIAGLVGATPVVYVYRVGSGATEPDEFEKAQGKGAKAIASFEEKIKDKFGRESVILNSLNALHPQKHLVTLPSFKEEKFTPADFLFIDRLKELILEQLQTQISARTVAESAKRAGASREDVLALLEKTVFFPQSRPSDPAGRQQALLQFKSEKHARVKSQDDYYLHNSTNRQSETALTQVKDKLSLFHMADFPEPWQQELIQYVYQTIDQTVKSFPGAGIGGHHFENSPPVTMRTCEYILAPELYQALREFEERDVYTEADRQEVTMRYRQMLQSFQITSHSWDRVTATPYGIHDLKLLADSGLVDGPCGQWGNATPDLIRNCVVDGLLFRAAMDIYTDLLWEMDAPDSEEDILALVKSHFTVQE